MELLESRSWSLLHFRDKSSIQKDNALELSACLDIPLSFAEERVSQVLDHYHFKTAPYPKGLDYSLFDFIIHLTQPLRGPIMTTRMDWVIGSLEKSTALKSALDYGGGGGKDSILLAKMGYEVDYSDLTSLLTPLVKRRFNLRGLSIGIHDVRDLPERRYDIINCMDVIEHAYDLEFVTADIIARLKEGGHLVCWPHFVNSWNGDHVEKNCGYHPYFNKMLEKVGVALEGHTPGALHFIRRRPTQGGIEAEREIIRRELYHLSRRMSLRAAAAGYAKLPLALGRIYLSRSQAKKDLLEQKISRIIDNLAIWRLSAHQLDTLPEAPSRET